MSEALLILVHGSPTPGANDDVERVAALIDTRRAFGIVKIGYLERNEPSIADAIDQCAAGGATTIIGVPYFLHIGTHVADDLPTLFDEGRKRHPNITFRLGRFLGESPVLTTILSTRATTALRQV